MIDRVSSSAAAAAQLVAKSGGSAPAPEVKAASPAPVSDSASFSSEALAQLAAHQAEGA